MMNDNVGITVFVQVLAVMQNVKKRNYVHVISDRRTDGRTELVYLIQRLQCEHCARCNEW